MSVVDQQDCHQDNRIHKISCVENSMPRGEKGPVHQPMSMSPSVEVDPADKDHAQEAHDQVKAQGADRSFFLCRGASLLPRCPHGFSPRDAPFLPACRRLPVDEGIWPEHSLFSSASLSGRAIALPHGEFIGISENLIALSAIYIRMQVSWSCLSQRSFPPLKRSGCEPSRSSAHGSATGPHIPSRPP